MKAHSHLTRHNFRALVANTPYRVRGCQLRTPSIQHAVRQSTRSFHSSRPQYLFPHLFGDTPKPLEGAKPTPQNVERAMTQLVDVVRARRLLTRPPPIDKLIDALKFMSSIRAQNPSDLTNTEIFLLRETLQHLVEQNVVLNDDVESFVTGEDLKNLSAALALHGEGETFRSEARKLAELIFHINRNQQGGNIDPEIFGSYVTVLARSGSPEHALDLLRKDESLSQEVAMLLWVAVLKSEHRPATFQKMLSELHEKFGPLSPIAHEQLVVFATSRGKFGLSRELLDYNFRGNGSPTTKSLAHILKLCIDKGQRSLGSYCADVLQERVDLGPYVDVLLLWFATDSQNHRLLKQKMLEFQAKCVGNPISMETFNVFIRHAYQNNDSKLVRNYLELADFFGLRPDGSTQTLALDHALSKEDLNAATDSFEALSDEDEPADRSDVPVLNKFLQKLTMMKSPPHQLIMRVVDRLVETGADLEADTIAGLCSLFLKRDETDQVTGLVRYRVDAFSKLERARIIAVFLDFIVDPATTDQLAWNAYDILRNAFPEMEVPDRIRLMHNFFERNRPEFACLVFGHMRQRAELEARPTAEAYAQCFFGIAKCKDVDGLQMVNNWLKLDREVEKTTKVHNALQAAYTACRTPFLAIIDHYWKILESREGPTLSTFLLALQACETWVPYGSLEARRIMALMQKWDLIITKEIYDTYIGAIAGQSEFENAVELIEHMEIDIGESPDALTIGILYNSIPWQYRKDEVEKWAKRRYPELWNELVSFGDVIDEEWEVRYFKISREIDTDDELLFGQGEYSPQLAQQARNTLGEPRNF